MNKLFAKLNSRTGETIAETLVALLISALALIMLAGAISTTSRIVTESENKMQEYYTANNGLAEPSGNDGSLTIADNEGKGVILFGKTSDIDIAYSKNDVFSGHPVVAYKKSENGGD